MSDVLDQAQNFSGGVVAAARKRESFLRRAANATDEETAAQYREAAADLGARYPEIEDLEIGGAEGFARQRGHGTGARSPVHGGRSRQRPGTTRKSSSSPAKSKGGGKPIPGVDPTATRGTRVAPQPTPKVDRAVRQTGIPSSIESGGSTVMMALGGTVSLSLLYLLLSSGEKGGSGGAALPKVIGAVTGFVGRFLGLGDFFPSNSRAKTSGAGGGFTNAGVNAFIKAARQAEAKQKRQKGHK